MIVHLYVILFNKIIINKINKELYGVIDIFLFIYIIYSYSFVESVRKNCDKKEWKEFRNFNNSSLQSLKRHFPKPMLSHT
jgi:hypothetical protein